MRLRKLAPHFSPPVAPRAGRFAVTDVVGSAWRHLMGDELQTIGRRRVLPTVCAALHLDSPWCTEIDAKAELLLLLHDESDPEAAALLERAQEAALLSVELLGMRHTLPPQRRATLCEDARGVAGALRDALSAHRQRLRAEGRLWAEPRLLRSLAAELRAARSAPPAIVARRSDSAAGRAAGVRMEEIAVAWARQTWPRSEVLPNVLLPGSAEHVKREVDALVLAAPCAGGAGGDGAGAPDEACFLAGEVAAIVEAKAGCSALQLALPTPPHHRSFTSCNTVQALLTDLPKLLAARDECFAPRATAAVRVGRGGPARTLAVGDAPPRLAYVLGGCDDLDGCVAASALASCKGQLLDRRMASAAPPHEWLRVGDGGGACGDHAGDAAAVGATATFADEDVSECQRRLDALGLRLRELLESGELSCWVPQPELLSTAAADTDGGAETRTMPA